SIGPIGDWVVRSACRDAQSWITAGHFDRSFRVHVNVSARQLGDAQFVDRTLASVRESGLEPSNLVLEISEKTMLADNPAVTRALSALKRSGVRIAIDDFGTGYSSLAHLRDFPADYLKLDGSLVRDLGQQGGDDPIVRSIIQLAHSLNMSVIAEWVSTDDQSPIGPIEPESSASSRKLGGVSVPRSGWCQRRSASVPTTREVCDDTTGWCTIDN
ncbi:MAG: EAL domain-containing protein, partial [Actinobacteria bacterium]|nr:EAL domain-containing protein [Actinomycetota bacterium]